MKKDDIKLALDKKMVIFRKRAEYALFRLDETYILASKNSVYRFKNLKGASWPKFLGMIKRGAFYRKKVLDKNNRRYGTTLKYIDDMHSLFECKKCKAKTIIYTRSIFTNIKSYSEISRKYCNKCVRKGFKNKCNVSNRYSDSLVLDSKKILEVRDMYKGEDIIIYNKVYYGYKTRFAKVPCLDCGEIRDITLESASLSVYCYACGIKNRTRYKRSLK